MVWWTLAAQQAGALGRRQLLAGGSSRSSIDRRVRTGRLVVELPGVYVVAGSPDTTARRRWVAMLATGPGAVLSFETAARMRGLSAVSTDGPTVVTVRHSGWRALPGIVVHQLNDLLPGHVGEIDGLAVTTVPRTIVDLAAIWPRGRMRIVVGDAVAAKRTTPGQIGDCLRSVARRGKPGVRTLATVLDELGPGKAPPASQLERVFFSLVRRSSLPDPHRQYPLPRGDGVRNLVDAAWPHVKVIIEVDGRRWHQRIADMKRDRDPRSAGGCRWVAGRSSAVRACRRCTGPDGAGAAERPRDSSRAARWCGLNALGSDPPTT